MVDAKTYWPDGKRIAVFVTFMFEVWSEGKAPTYGVQTTALKPGQIDHGGINWSRYGGRVGIWRLMRAMEHFGLRASIASNSKCAEVFPEVFDYLRKSKHEVVAHGVWQDELIAYMTPENEQKAIRETFAGLEKALGKRPEGWMSPVMAHTPHTADFLAQDKVLWFGDFKDSDMPKRLKTKHGTVVALPISEYTDNRVLRGGPIDFFHTYKDTFDYLHQNEPGSLLHVTIHCHWGGRPPIVALFHKLLEYFKQFPDVWFTTQGEIAHWVMDQNLDEISYADRFFKGAR